MSPYLKLPSEHIIIDGIDKSGKDTIAKYVWYLDKRLNVFVRGWPSLVVYAKKFNRQCEYELPYKDVLYVHCYVDENDWSIRCNITNESKINYDNDTQMFFDAFDILDNNNYYTMTFNTTQLTPYIIAKQIIDTVGIKNVEMYLKKKSWWIELCYK